MTKSRYIKYKPPKLTELAKKVLRARLSEHETQMEFASRFLVSNITVHNWETGRTNKLQPVHQRILDGMMERLRTEGRLLSEDILKTIVHEEEERKELFV